MNEKELKTLIDAYRQFSDLLSDIEPVISKNAAAAVSLSQYVRNFSLAMIMRVDSHNPAHLDFINNLTVISLPEMDREEYRHAITCYNAAHYDEYLFDKQIITQTLMSYDCEHKTHTMRTLAVHLSGIAEIFVNQQPAYESTIKDFIVAFKSNAESFIRSNGTVLMNGKSTADTVETANTAKTQAAACESSLQRPQSQTPVQAQQYQKQTFRSNATVDGQYVLRVLAPMFALIAFVFGAVAAEEWVLLLIAIAPLCFLVAGIRAAGRRCPNCKAWDSMVTTKSRKVGQQRVKVRRNLHSSYYRTSGTHTFGSRQVFVSADEYTYDEVYRCNVCGFETKGQRRVIDDGIR